MVKTCTSADCATNTTHFASAANFLKWIVLKEKQWLNDIIIASIAWHEAIPPAPVPHETPARNAGNFITRCYTRRIHECSHQLIIVEGRRKGNAKNGPPIKLLLMRRPQYQTPRYYLKQYDHWQPCCVLLPNQLHRCKAGGMSRILHSTLYL